MTDAAPLTVAWVADLWRHPVKSMQGERLEQVEVTDHGIASDRRWAVIDEQGRALAAKTEPRLLMAEPRLDGDQVLIVLPTGAEIRSADPDADTGLSAWLDRPVFLREATPDVTSSYILHIDPADDDSELVEVPTPVGSFADSRHHLHALTVASLRAGQALHPDGQWDSRRFRAGLVIDTDGEGFVEDEWVGRELHIGDLVLEIRKQTLRCAIPGRAQPGLDRDVEVVRTLARHHEFNLGVYCGVLRPGVIAVGDPVMLG